MVGLGVRACLNLIHVHRADWLPHKRAFHRERRQAVDNLLVFDKVMKTEISRKTGYTTDSLFSKAESLLGCSSYVESRRRLTVLTPFFPL
ncbi:hypothetical protein CSUI_006310 [Cystoisospora suis]|uniref:Uncharacterized protein n=1 Tax=Cystoisospora suis TaxID=483139 RepID=A0A2C6K1A4_9APIC|nr:hypothetical protein CSUI_006310 [Cystoisospora suis]